jgi:hypothetical protein
MGWYTRRCARGATGESTHEGESSTRRPVAHRVHLKFRALPQVTVTSKVTVTCPPYILDAPFAHLPHMSL